MSLDNITDDAHEVLTGIVVASNEARRLNRSWQSDCPEYYMARRYRTVVEWSVEQVQMHPHLRPYTQKLGLVAADNETSAAHGLLNLLMLVSIGGAATGMSMPSVALMSAVGGIAALGFRLRYDAQARDKLITRVNNVADLPDKTWLEAIYYLRENEYNKSRR